MKQPGPIEPTAPTAYLGLPSIVIDREIAYVSLRKAEIPLDLILGLMIPIDEPLLPDERLLTDSIRYLEFLNKISGHLKKFSKVADKPYRTYKHFLAKTKPQSIYQTLLSRSAPEMPITRVMKRLGRLDLANALAGKVYCMQLPIAANSNNQANQAEVVGAFALSHIPRKLEAAFDMQLCKGHKIYEASSKDNPKECPIETTLARNQKGNLVTVFDSTSLNAYLNQIGARLTTKPANELKEAITIPAVSTDLLYYGYPLITSPNGTITSASEILRRYYEVEYRTDYYKRKVTKLIVPPLDPEQPYAISISVLVLPHPRAVPIRLSPKIQKLDILMLEIETPYLYSVAVNT